MAADRIPVGTHGQLSRAAWGPDVPERRRGRVLRRPPGSEWSISTSSEARHTLQARAAQLPDGTPLARRRAGGATRPHCSGKADCMLEQTTVRRVRLGALPPASLSARPKKWLSRHRYPYQIPPFVVAGYLKKPRGGGPHGASPYHRRCHASVTNYADAPGLQRPDLPQPAQSGLTWTPKDGLYNLCHVVPRPTL